MVQLQHAAFASSLLSIRFTLNILHTDPNSNLSVLYAFHEMCHI